MSTCAKLVVRTIVLAIALQPSLAFFDARDVRAFPGTAPASSQAYRCAKAIEKTSAKIFKARLKECSSCEKRQAADTESETVACAVLDSRGKVASAIASSFSTVLTVCSDETISELSLGPCGTDLSSLQSCVNAYDSTAKDLCVTMHGAAALTAAQKIEGKCQATIAKWVTKYGLMLLKEQGKCLAASLKAAHSPDVCTSSLSKIAATYTKATTGLLADCSESALEALHACDPPAVAVADLSARVLSDATCRTERIIKSAYGLPSPTCANQCGVPTSTTATSTSTTTASTSTTTASSTTSTSIPTTDSDLDGIADAIDTCALVYNPEQGSVPSFGCNLELPPVTISSSLSTEGSRLNSHRGSDPVLNRRRNRRSVSGDRSRGCNWIVFLATSLTARRTSHRDI